MGDCGGSCSDGTCGTDGRNGLPPGMLSQYDLNQSTAEGTLVWIEIVRTSGVPQIAEVSREIVSKIRKTVDGRIFGVVFGHNELKSVYDEIFSLGVDTLYHVKDERLTVYHPEAYCESIVGLCERIVPALVLIGSTPKGKELAPRAAALMNAGLVADCVEFKAEGRTVIMTKMTGESLACNTFPQMATVVPGIFRDVVTEAGRKGTVIYRQYCGDSFKEIISSEPRGS